MTSHEASYKARNPRSATRSRFSRFACVALLFAIGCCGVRRASGQVFADDKDSCRNFVQNFYDWYWNPYVGQADMPGLRALTLADVLKRKPPVLGPDLLKLLKKARLTGTVDSLGFDPFLNSNPPHVKYTVSKVELTGDVCRASIDAGHEIAALKKAGASWLFVDFRYSYYYQDGSKQGLPDADLIQLLTS
jgi:hypothetical protein